MHSIMQFYSACVYMEYRDRLSMTFRFGAFQEESNEMNKRQNEMQFCHFDTLYNARKRTNDGTPN